MTSEPFVPRSTSVAALPEIVHGDAASAAIGGKDSMTATIISKVEPLRTEEGYKDPASTRQECSRSLRNGLGSIPYNVRVMEPTVSPKTRRIEVRLSDEERQLDAAAASALGESLSDFFRRAAQTRAQEVLADQRTISLSEVEATRFLEALERPDEGTVGRLEDLRRRA